MSRLGAKNHELAEMNRLSAQLGYDMWSDAAADLLKDSSIRRRGLTAEETQLFLEMLRERV